MIWSESENIIIIHAEGVPWQVWMGGARGYHPTPEAWNGSDGTGAVNGWSVGWGRQHKSPRFGGGGSGSNRG